MIVAGLQVMASNGSLESHFQLVSRFVWDPKLTFGTLCFSYLSRLGTQKVPQRIGSPQMWVWPQLVFGGSPPSRIAIGGPFPQAKALPSPPSPSLFPPPPLALFAMLWDGAAQSGVGGGVLGCRGEWRGGPSSGTWGQTHIWGYSKETV